MKNHFERLKSFFSGGTRPAEVAVAPIDNLEPLINNREELVLAAAALCLQAYMLMDGKTEDYAGERLRSFAAVHPELKDEKLVDVPNIVSYWEITDTKIGSNEPIPSRDPTRDFRTPKITAQIGNHATGWFLDSHGNMFKYGDHAATKRDIYIDRAAQETSESVSSLVVCASGLALVTETYDRDTSAWEVTDFEANSINPDDIFAPSSTQEEHQALYRKMMQLFVEHFGENLPQAPDIRPMYGERPGRAAVSREVDISQGGIDPDAKAKIIAARGTEWQQYPRPKAKKLIKKVQAERVKQIRAQIQDKAQKIIDLHVNTPRNNSSNELNITLEKGDTTYTFCHYILKDYGERACIIVENQRDGRTDYEFFTREKDERTMTYRGKPIDLHKAPEIMQVLDQMLQASS